MLDLSEKSLETMIYEYRETIFERGFVHFYKNTERQFRLPCNFIIDLFTYEVKDNVLYYKIIELKKAELTMEAVFQIVQYFLWIWEYTENQYERVEWELILVGDDMDAEVWYLTHLEPRISFYEYKFGYDGLFFNKKPTEISHIGEELKKFRSESLAENEQLVKDRQAVLSKLNQ